VRRAALTAALVLATLVAGAAPAGAFCGFYVAGSGAKLVNNATQVVLLRLGTTTVLSMRNNYQGPPEGFAMVVPVPVVLGPDSVKTLPLEVFDRIDAMGSPRLVEYWEQDPCAMGELIKPESESLDARDFARSSGDGGPAGPDGVTVEAQFAVGEYDIVILSATESTGLERWLRGQGYRIPADAEALLRPYVASGAKFFVAKVDPTKVVFANGMAMLSPLRVHYDADELTLPIRLGLANSAGTQDLIVNVIAPHRFEVANRPNVPIPTNLDVKGDVRARFGEFYAALFDRTVATHPGAVITEYAWDTFTCDPCPGPALDGSDLGTLGLDVAWQHSDPDAFFSDPMTLTRLHLRYGADDVRDDLVFKEAAAIEGGREERDHRGALEVGANLSTYANNFQARYVIRHRWTGPVDCGEDAKWGVWGEPPAGQTSAGLATARDLAFVPRGNVALEQYLDVEAIPDLGLPHAKARGCGCSGAADGAGPAVATLLIFLGLHPSRRRRRPVVDTAPGDG